MALLGLWKSGRGPGRAGRGARAGAASVQDAHVGAVLAGVRRAAAVLTDGSCRAVLQVGGVDLGLQRPSAQEATLAGFAACLNALAYPVQILVRLVPVDLEPHASRLEERALGELEEPLAGLALEHAAFLRRLGRQRSLIERRFYVVVPVESAAGPAAGRGRRVLGVRLGRRRAAGGGDAGGVGRPDAETPTAFQRRQLDARCAEVAGHLARCDLPARRLDDGELAALLYACWCPDLSRRQPLRAPLRDLTAPVVRAAVSAP